MPRSLLIFLFLVSCPTWADVSLYSGNERIDGADVKIYKYGTYFGQLYATVSFETTDGPIAVDLTLPTKDFRGLPFVYFERDDCTGSAFMDATHLEVSSTTAIVGRNSMVYVPNSLHPQTLPRTRWTGTSCEPVSAPKAGSTFIGLRAVRALPRGDLQIGLDAGWQEESAILANGLPVLGTHVELVASQSAKENSATQSRWRTWWRGLTGNEFSPEVMAEEKWGLMWFAADNTHKTVFMYLHFSDDSYAEEGFGLYRDVDQGLLFPTKDCSGDVAYYHTDIASISKSKIRGAAFDLFGPGNSVFAETNASENYVPRNFFKKSDEGSICSSVWFPESEYGERFEMVHQFPSGDLTLASSG